MMHPALMQLTASDHLLWGLATFLELLLCVLVVWRGLHRRLPFFSAYLALAFASGILVWWAYYFLNYGSWAAWYFSWTVQGMILVARGLVIAELCRVSLRAYRGIWALAWRLLCAIALFLLVSAAINAREHADHLASFVQAGERGLELAAAVVLLSLFLICRYYQIRIEHAPRVIAFGLCFHSLIQVLNNSFMAEWLALYVPWWNGIRLASFQVALVIWLLALRKPLPAAAPAPALLPQTVYDELSPQLNYRLRVLNQRLLEILRP
jgi:hypothetical protein